MHARSNPLDSPALYPYGFPEVAVGAAPAAGTDFSASISGRYYTRLVAVTVRLTTSATVANREVTLQYATFEGSVYCTAGAPTTVPASSTYDYTFSAFQPEAVWPVDTGILVPLAPIILRPTDKFVLHLVNAQAADTLTAIRYVWERFFTDSPVPGGLRAAADV